MKLSYLFSCQCTHSVMQRLLGPNDTLLCVLIQVYKQYISYHQLILHMYVTAELYIYYTKSGMEPVLFASIHPISIFITSNDLCGTAFDLYFMTE